jgi:hypothetical protein
MGAVELPERRELRFVQLESDRADEILELLHTADAHDGRRHTRLIENPRERHSSGW